MFLFAVPILVPGSKQALVADVLVFKARADTSKFKPPPQPMKMSVRFGSVTDG